MFFPVPAQTRTRNEYDRLLPVLTGALACERLSFQQYLALRRDVAAATGSCTADFAGKQLRDLVRAEQEELSLEGFKLGALADSKMHLSDGECLRAVCDYLGRGDHISALEEHRIASLGAAFTFSLPRKMGEAD